METDSIESRNGVAVDGLSHAILSLVPSREFHPRASAAAFSVIDKSLQEDMDGRALKMARPPAAASSTDHYDAEAMSDDPAQQQDARTEIYPELLPMQHPYRGKTFYVRKCYPEYYDLIMKELEEDMEIITVTGTPGSGKSLFLAYFFLKYKEAFPSATIVVASFCNTMTLIDVVVWKDEAFHSCPENIAREFCLEKHAIKSKRTTLRTEASCSSESWIDKVRKNKYHVAFYMSIWSRQGLHDAASALELESDEIYPVDDEMVDDRFEVFGGMARYCFARREAFVATEKFRLNLAITTMFTVNDLSRVVHRENERSHHLLCYYMPVEGKPGMYTVQTASKYAEVLLLEYICKREYKPREELLRWVRCVLPSTVFGGFLFKIRAHEQLMRGIRLSVRRLGTGYAHHEVFTIETSQDFHFFESAYSQSVLSCGKYHVPRAKNFAAIDSFYFPMVPGKSVAEVIELVKKGGQQLLLFQMTQPMTHPVKGSGIADVLSRLGLVNEDGTMLCRGVALVFVVPKANAASFSSQDIELVPTSMDAHVSCIKGITRNTAKELEQRGIRTVADLQCAVEKEEFRKLKTKLDRHMHVIQSQPDGIASIPQYVCGI